MLPNKPFAFLVLACLMYASSSFAGQETGGGDLLALMFVKSGRLLLQEMQTNPQCKLARKTATSLFQTNLDRIEIESADAPTKAPQRYVFDRMHWYWLPLQEKVREVFGVYSGKSEDISSGDIQSCMRSSEWNKIHSPIVYDERLDTAHSKDEAESASKELLTVINNWHGQSFLKQVSITDLQRIIAQTDFVTSPSYMNFRRDTFKDGINLESGHRSKIILNTSLWATLSRGQKMEFLLHEYLRLAGVDDRKYQISSRLFLLIDESKYNS